MSKAYKLDSSIQDIHETLEDGTCFFRKFLKLYEDVHEMEIIRIIASVASPHLLRIYKVGPTYYDAELLDLTYSDVSSLKDDICTCLHVLHELGIVHLDIHSHNVGYSHVDKCWKLFDFDCSGVVGNMGWNVRPGHPTPPAFDVAKTYDWNQVDEMVRS
jgi:serine/threonine protein kinase